MSSTMDVARPWKSPWPRRVLSAGAILALLALGPVALRRLRSAAPKVDRASIWVGTVKRGEMVRQVRGNGTLVPEDVRWVTATSAGRVERIALLPGVMVKADTLLIELSNPELERAVLELEAQARAAKAQLLRLKLQLESDQLAERSAAASLRSDLTMTRIEAEGDEELSAKGYGPALVAKRSRARADQLTTLVSLQDKRSETLGRSGRAQLLVQRAEIAKIDAEAQLRRAQLGALKVRAGIDGVLQRLGDEQPLRVGQHVAVGAVLARIANQMRLKAEIKIPETQAKDVQLGQATAIDTLNGVIAGHVVRIDPAVQNGTVTVDVAPESALPAGARPDLSVDGTITLERFQNVLYLERPVGVPAGSRAGLFEVIDGGHAARRVSVRLGRSSVDTIEILAGLGVGDEVILSDTSPWDSYDRISLN